jgi:hypothetical protein
VFVGALSLGGILACEVCAAPFDAAVGTWRGAVQFNTNTKPELHSIGKFGLFVQTDGSVQAEHENGCKFSGIIQRGITEQMFNLNLTAKSCAQPMYSIRWSGYIVVNAKERSAKFSLNERGKGARVDLIQNPSIHGHLQPFMLENARQS